MSEPRIAAIVTLHSGEADGLLAAFARQQRAAGRRVRGLLQKSIACDDDGCTYAVVDLDDGREYPISQDLGSGSQACSLDPGLIAEASLVMRRIGQEGAELAIFNRFGGLEAEGGGFAAEMLHLMSSDIPVLTVVPARFLAIWRDFTGGLAEELPPTPAALADWFATLPAQG